MTTKPTDSWAEEFEAKFLCNGRDLMSYDDKSGVSTSCGEIVKDFISSQIAKAEARGAKDILWVLEKEVEDVKIFCLLHHKLGEKLPYCEHEKERNSFIDEIRTQITNLKSNLT